MKRAQIDSELVRCEAELQLYLGSNSETIKYCFLRIWREVTLSNTVSTSDEVGIRTNISWLSKEIPYDERVVCTLNVSYQGKEMPYALELRSCNGGNNYIYSFSEKGKRCNQYIVRGCDFESSLNECLRFFSKWKEIDEKPRPA